MGAKLADDVSYLKAVSQYLRASVARYQTREAVPRASGYFWWAYNGNSNGEIVVA
jgi:hypothetical protein